VAYLDGVVGGPAHLVGQGAGATAPGQGFAAEELASEPPASETTMTSRQPPDRGAVAATDRPGHARARPWRRPLPPVPVRALGYATAAWCLGFAGVSAWLVAAGPTGNSDARQRYAAYASGLAIMSVLVLVLKLAGAAVALAAVLVGPERPRRPPRLLGVALWGAFGLLGLYSAGNLAITVGTVSGLLAPSAAWTAAGGVTAKAILYVLFFLAGAALFGVLAVWFHRRHHLQWTSAVAGLAGAPLLLALILAAAPAILGRWGLLPT
jgi:hypothetical protein